MWSPTPRRTTTAKAPPNLGSSVIIGESLTWIVTPLSVCQREEEGGSRCRTGLCTAVKQWCLQCAVQDGTRMRGKKGDPAGLVKHNVVVPGS